MKFALVEGSGRIAQVETLAFPVAAPLRWVKVPDDTVAEDSYIDGRVVKRAVQRQMTVEDYARAIQAYLDRRARQRGYDSIFTAVTYADEPAVATFQAEGRAYRAWRSLVWEKCYAILAEIQAGTRAAPRDLAEIIAELPVLELP